MPTIAREASRFVAVGAICFVIDAALTRLVVSLGVNPYASRCVGFSCALAASWSLNRTYTFRGRRIGRRDVEFAAFALANIPGATVNLATYALIVATTWAGPVAAVAAGSMAGMVSNFAFARFVVFGPPPSLPR
ncbi:MAG TPA: GtrA family protein [Stellaceae bacterium]|nr:GtrA family protein [Stellaceae bacterium]